MSTSGGQRRDAETPRAEASVEERPWLMSIEELSFLLNRSVASLERDAAMGRLPTAVRLGKSRRWIRQEMLRWVEAGCPPRTDGRARSRV